MKTIENDYEELHNLSRRTKILCGVNALLEWDQETHMPEGAGAIRAEQLQLLAGMIHQEKTGSKFKNALQKLVDLKTGQLKANGLPTRKKAALREWYRDYKREDSLPSSFVEEFTRTTSQALQVWREAKDNDSYQQFQPYLDKIVTLSRRKADYLGWEEHPYDALLDLYEPDITTKEVDTLFTGLKTPIVKLLKKIKAAKQVKNDFLYGRFSEKKQYDFSYILMEDMGFNFEHGCLDESSHPFSSAAHPHDSRITTRIHPNFLLSNILVIIHETGHSLYEMGLPPEEYGSPLGEAISLGMHECQSRWWETRIGQSKPFWKHYLPILKDHFNKLDRISLDAFYKGINRVEPTMIRVDADEVTYPLHVILRFELEKQLIEGSLKVRDVPEAWNEQMQNLLGVTPPSNEEGCLQDIHWSMGGFGYFPTYTLGTIYASNLFTAFEKTFPSWDKTVGKGDLLFITDWLKENVHRHGRQYSSPDLIKKITGRKPTAKVFTDYLEEKYSAIYKIK